MIFCSRCMFSSRTIAAFSYDSDCLIRFSFKSTFSLSILAFVFFYFKAFEYILCYISYILSSYYFISCLCKSLTSLRCFIWAAIFSLSFPIISSLSISNCCCSAILFSYISLSACWLAWLNSAIFILKHSFSSAC